MRREDTRANPAGVTVVDVLDLGRLDDPEADADLDAIVNMKLPNDFIHSTGERV